MIIVGSKALKFYFPNIDRHINDVDVIGTNQDLNFLIKKLKPKQILVSDKITTLKEIQNSDTIFNTKNVEILMVDESEALTKYLEFSKPEIRVEYAPLEVLYSLKKSHIHFPIKFDKHILDYCLLNDFFNGYDKLSEITKLNFKETENRLGKLKTPSLNKSVKQFFGQSEGYVKSHFIHDDIHKVVAHYDKPIYESLQKDATLAKCEKDLWNLLSFEDKCKTVLEEAYVIALERKIIPALFGGKPWTDSEKALDWAFMRICTTLCSGWFRQFATDNYFRIKEFINKDYVELFLTKYQNGEIKKITNYESSKI